MKKFFFMALTAMFAFAFASCNDSDDVAATDEKSSLLSITTEISAQQSLLKSGPLSVFPEESKLSLWVTPGTLGTNYNVGPYNNVLAEYKSGKWELTPQVKLSETSATIYAFYPYSTSYTNGKDNMHIYHTNQVDYMYGVNAEGQEAINRANPNVRLRMKHALALLQFRIKKINYPGESKVTRIEVANNTSKQELRSGASINIANGELSYLGNQFSPAVVENYNGIVTVTEETPTEEKDFANVMVLPVAQTAAAGNILIKFTIDDTVYIYYVPVNTTWKQGTKHIYNVTLNGTQLIIDDVIITEWTEGPVNNVELF